MEHSEVFWAFKKKKSACASSSLSVPISHNFAQNHLEHIGQEALIVHFSMTPASIISQLN